MNRCTLVAKFFDLDYTYGNKSLQIKSQGKIERTLKIIYRLQKGIKIRPPHCAGLSERYVYYSD